MTTPTTGWAPGMLQDDSRDLSKWLANKPDALQHVKAQRDQGKLLQIIAAAYQIAGACDAPAHILDVLANPQLATQAQIDAMLPFVHPAHEPLTDEYVTKLWGSLQARKIAEARFAHSDLLGKVCGACEIGTFGIDSNGYNTFLRCGRCARVPFIKNGVDITRQKMQLRSEP